MFLRYLYVTGEQGYGDVNAPVRDLSGFFQQAVFWLIRAGLLGLCQGGLGGGRSMSQDDKQKIAGRRS